MNHRAVAGWVTLCFAGAAALSGCTSASREADLGVGWRKGTVVQLGVASTFGPPVAGDCRSRMEDANGERRFALVEYFSGRIAHRRIVPIAASQEAAVGDPIYINLLTCRESIAR